jgi:hypothetical protein
MLSSPGTVSSTVNVSQKWSPGQALSSGLSMYRRVVMSRIGYSPCHADSAVVIMRMGSSPSTVDSTVDVS